jgi:hypothetical protein
MSGTMIKVEIKQAFDGLEKDLTVSNLGELDYDVIRKLI